LLQPALFFPEIEVEMGPDAIANEASQHVGIERVQFPGLTAKLGDVRTGPRVGDLGRVRRWAVLANLIDIERDSMEAQHSGLPPKKEYQATLDVTAHVESARIMVAEVKDMDLLPTPGTFEQPLAGVPHLGLRRVPAAGEVRS